MHYNMQERAHSDFQSLSLTVNTFKTQTFVWCQFDAGLQGLLD